MNPEIPAATKAELLSRPGTLVVVRRPAGTTAEQAQLYLAVFADSTVVGFNSHVDIGTGIRTALTQIVAEELDSEMDQVAMLLGDSAWAPPQGDTVASRTIQFTAIPLRCAAAQARFALLTIAAHRLNVEVADLEVIGGKISRREGGNLSFTFGELLTGQTLILELDTAFPVKDAASHRLVGRSPLRLDIPAKVTGKAIYVHDMRVENMLHGRVVRPPYAGIDTGSFVGRALRGVDEASIQHIPGIVKLVVIHDFVGIVAEREEQAEAAAQALRLDWGPFGRLPDLENPEQALRDNPRVTRKLVDRGDVDAALEAAATRLSRTYVWPYQLHGSIGPSCSVAAFDPAGNLTVWTGTSTPQMLRADLGMLLDMAENNIKIVRMEAAGAYGRNCMDDVGADAALLARAVGRPVRVQLSRAQESLWEPKGAAQLMEVEGGIDSDGALAAYQYATSFPSNMGPMLALLLTRRLAPEAGPTTLGDRTAIPPYSYPNLRISVHDMAPIARAAFLRGVSALPATFAHESFVDELAITAGEDPVAYRLRHMQDQRAIELAQAVTARAGWEKRTAARQLPAADSPDSAVVRGQGFAHAVYVHGDWPGEAAAWSAWVAEVEVNRRTGEIAVTRIVAGQDSGQMINPDGVRHQLTGNVIQSTSRTLKEQVAFQEGLVIGQEWGSYPILQFPELPRIDVVMMPRPRDPPLGAGESASLPSAAAIANAVFDATGVRFRELPLTPEKIRAGLGETWAPSASPAAPVAAPMRAPKRSVLNSILAGGIALLTSGLLAWPWRPAFPPIPPPGAGIFSAATIERGRQLAALGDCAVCHTAPGGAINAGGLALETQFGTIYSTNITPDSTGIGNWSYPAFERAMREGISRDGHHLYPAFPYTAFSRMTDADLSALYAYLMAQPPSAATPNKNNLKFPFNIRPLIAAWNGLYLRPGTMPVDPQQSEQWNRGAYLAESVGHCAACHTPRDAMGGVLGAAWHFAGGMAEGWEAPPLAEYSNAPIPWNEAELYAYLRTGASPQHGPAGGPMAPVIHSLRNVPDQDIRAIAHYVAALDSRAPPADSAGLTRALTTQGETALQPADSSAARLFDGACAVCHVSYGPQLFGPKWALAINSNVYSAIPDNLINIILNGSANLNDASKGAMPPFRYNLNDRQIARLVDYIRQTQAPGKPAWTNLEQTVARLRARPTPADHIEAHH